MPGDADLAACAGVVTAAAIAHVVREIPTRAAATAPAGRADIAAPCAIEERAQPRAHPAATDLSGQTGMAAEPAVPNITPAVDAVRLAAISERTRTEADAIHTVAARTTRLAARPAIPGVALQVDACRYLAGAIGYPCRADAAARCWIESGGPRAHSGADKRTCTLARGDIVDLPWRASAMGATVTGAGDRIQDIRRQAENQSALGLNGARSPEHHTGDRRQPTAYHPPPRDARRQSPADALEERIRDGGLP
jgi:hypothetical protein